MAKRIYTGILGAFALIVFFCSCSQETNKNINFDLNQDGNLETIFLEGGIASVEMNRKTVFSSDPAHKVIDILSGDFNNDRQTDFALVLWKKGNYGNSKPFWVSENDDSYKMHLFLYTWKNNKINPLWHSSNLPKENLVTRLVDLNKDNKNELLVIEKDYHDQKLSLAVWQWDIWGFTLKRRIPITFQTNKLLQ